MGNRSFEDLEGWQRACRMPVDVYDVLKGCRDYGLGDQMTHAAVSVAPNIAEGAERDPVAEYIRFIHITKGSAAELRTQTYIAHHIGIVDDPTQARLTQELKEISAMLHSLAKTQKSTT